VACSCEYNNKTSVVINCEPFLQNFENCHPLNVSRFKLVTNSSASPMKVLP
jgi:hypothetical protein